ncbi:MAG: hypothetical protein GY756_11075, partial [bacterium]|nr:hypothetical protein [bacterium]
KSKRVDVLPEMNNGSNVSKAVSEISISKENTDILLTKINQAFNTGINDILLTALARSISKWYGGKKISIDLESHGRSEGFNDIDLSRTIGWFTSIYPVILDISDCNNIGDEIITVKESLREIPDNGIGFGILKYIACNQSLVDMEDSEIAFNYLGQFHSDMNTDLFGIAPESVGQSVSPKAKQSYKLVFNGMIAGGRFSMTLESDIYGKETLDQILELYKRSILELINFISSLSCSKNNESNEEEFYKSDSEVLFI